MSSLQATVQTGSTKTLNKENLAEFKSSLRGDLLLPGDSEFDSARKLWNDMIDRRPALIVQCRGTHDVTQAVNFARAHNLIIAVRGGGHNVAGNAVCEDGMMIDLSQMRSAHVNKKNKTVRVDGGCLLGDADHETQLHGLAVSAGVRQC